MGLYIMSWKLAGLVKTEWEASFRNSWHANCEVLTSCPLLKQGCVSADHNSCDSTWRAMVLSQCFNYAFECWILGMLFYWMCVYCSCNKNSAFACAACALWCFESTADLGLIEKCLSCCVSGMCCFSTASFLLWISKCMFLTVFCISKPLLLAGRVLRPFDSCLWPQTFGNEFFSRNSLLDYYFSKHRGMHAQFHTSKNFEVCCSCRVGIAIDTGEIIVTLSGDSIEGGKKPHRQRKVTVVYLNSLTLVNLT